VTEARSQADVATNRINRRSLHYAPPDFLFSEVALANFMRLSLRKAAYVALGGSAM